MFKFSKKLLAVTTAVALATVGFVAAPASAESVSSFVNRYVSSTVFRKVDPTNYQVQYKNNDMVSINGSASLKPEAVAAHVNIGDTVTITYSEVIVSGTIRSNPYSYLHGNLSGISTNVSMDGNGSVSKVISAVPSNITMNFNYNTNATSDLTIAVTPKITAGSYTFVASDFQDFNVTATTGRMALGSKSSAPVTGLAIDARINFEVPPVCVDTTGLTNSDTLEVLSTVSDGSANVGTINVNWSIKSADGQYLSDGMNTTFPLTNFSQGNKIVVNAMTAINPVTAGKTYTHSNFKVVKQGSTTDLSATCKTTGVTGTVAVASNVITATLDDDADGMPGFDSYICVLYSSSDSTHETPIKSVSAMKWGMNGPLPNPICTVSGAAAGTYSVSVRGTSYQGLSNEVFLPGTVTVTGASKKAPKVPTVGTKLKKGKTLAIALHSSKGTSSKGANADGLATAITVSSASKKICSVTAVKKSNKITGYTVKGLKAGTCSVVVTITGNTAFNALTKTVAVKVS